MDDEARAWEVVRAHMLRVCGISLEQDQRYLLKSRLENIAFEHGFKAVSGFVDAACSAAPKEPIAQALVDAMTTHESFFFRDALFWQTFEEEVVPNILSVRNGNLSVWCAACAHGQEPYTIAMVLQERWPEVFARLHIYGADVSAPAVQRARGGIFSGLEVNRGLDAKRVAQHFEPVRGGFRIKGSLRERITWNTHNLLTDTVPASGVDIALCRNVLIYMNTNDRKKVLNGISQATATHGYIGVGATEMIWNTPSQRGWYRKDRTPERY